MPSLGADMDEGKLLEWRIAPGDRVARGQIVALVDTDKAEIEIECWQTGVVERLLIEPGRTVAVGTPIALLKEEAAVPAARKEPAPKPAAAPAPAPAAPTAPPLPAARPAAPPPPKAAAPAPPAPHLRATPLARRLAQQRGVDLAALSGSGPGGAIVGEDVLHAAAAAAQPAGVAPPQGEVAAPAAEGRDHQQGMRRAIAAAMARSKREIPHYYLETSIDCSRALAWLRERNLGTDVTQRALPIALLLKATALALRKAPELNGLFVDGAFRPGAGIHLGVAVALRGGGLVAPALRDADALSLGDLMRGLRDLTQRAREGRLRSSEMSDATITVTSLGDLGVESVFGVIYPPQVAIVGFGRIAEKPWAENGMLAVREVVRCTLSADHRVSDGMRGARFLAEIARLLGQPEALS